LTRSTDDDLERARVTLEEAGFALTEDKRYPTVFGNRVLRFDNGKARIVIERDRDVALLGIFNSSGTSSHDVGVWVACLDHVQPELEGGDWIDDLAVFLNRLAEIEHLIAEGGSALDECLSRTGMWRLMARHEGGLIRSPYE
jgi:hypothetical protein